MPLKKDENKKEITVSIKPDLKTGAYAHRVNITYSSVDMTFNFIKDDALFKNGDIVARVTVHPQVAREIHRLLGEMIEKQEDRILGKAGKK